MKTYQDFQKATDYRVFIRDAVSEFINSEEYRQAKAGELYYARHNETIEKYQKKLYTLSGQEVVDIFSANYKLKSLFFRRLVIQLTQYVLGNGVKVKGKEKLGKDFDYQLQHACKHALAAGRAFLFWNHDRVQVMSYVNTNTEPGFLPLYDENTGELMAGIRFWNHVYGDDVIWFYTLYTTEGYMDFSGKNEEKPNATSGLQHYMVTTVKTEADGIIEEVGSDYGRLPIVTLYANDTHESELTGVRECIDAYDFIKSNFCNEIDDSSGFYWLLKNSGGMEDPDIAALWQRLKSTHGAALEGDQDIELQTLNVPVEARKTMLEILRKDIYEDAQMLDVTTLSAAAKTTQEIQAAYQYQDNKAADLEYQLLQALDKLLPLAGVNAECVFTWQKVVNETEQTSELIMVANYLSDETIVRHIPFLTPEEAEEEIARLKEQEAEAYSESLIDQGEEGTEQSDGTADLEEQGKFTESLLDSLGNDIISMLEGLMGEE